MGPLDQGIFKLAIAAAFAGLAFWLVLALRGRGGRIDPACGRCGYLARGLTTSICPECGSDLREVGIDKWKRPDRPMRLWQSIVIWALLTPIPAYLGARLIVAAVSPQRQSEFQTVLVDPSTLAAHKRFELYRSCELGRWPWMRTFSALRPVGYSACGMTLSGNGMNCVWVKQAGRDSTATPPSSADVEVVINNIRRSEPGLSPEACRQDAIRIVAALDEAARTDDLPRAVATHFGGSPTMWRAPQPVRRIAGDATEFSVSVVLWLAGLWALPFIARRQLRRTSSSPISPATPPTTLKAIS